MAIVNLQLSALNMETLPVAYYKIIEAINERKTILNAFGIDTSYSQDWSQYTGGYGFVDRNNPNYAMCMNSLMYCVNRMGQYFVDLSGDYIQDSYANFPKTYSHPLKEDTEHNIGVSVRQYDSFEDNTIESWRQVLYTAAYWLNKYTAINVPNNYRTVNTNCSYTSYDLSASDQFVPENMKERKSDMRFTITHHSMEYDRPTSSGSDHYYNGYRRCSGYFGLALDNRTPYPAKVLLYLCLPSVPDDGRDNWKNVQKWQNYHYRMEICSRLWIPDPDDPSLLYPGVADIDNDTFIYAGGNWKQSIDDHTKIIYSAGRETGTENYQLSAIEVYDKKNYTPDGRQNIVLDHRTTEEGEDRHTYYLAWAENELEMYHDRIWDGLGIWTSPSEPYLAEIIPARTKKKIDATFFNPVPEPQQSRLSEVIPTGWRHGSCWWEENFTNSYELRVVPILDYSDSVTTFSFDEE